MSAAIVRGTGGDSWVTLEDDSEDDLDQVGQDSEDEDLDQDSWRTCWKVDMCFQRSLAKTVLRRCIICKSKFRASYLSDFLSTSTLSDCQHIRHKKYACSTCNEDFLYNVLRGERKCFDDQCTQKLRLAIDKVNEILQEEQDLLEEFTAIVLKLVPRTFYCVICMEDLPIDTHRPGKKVSPACEHDECNTCLECMTSLVDSAVNNASWTEIKCPECAAELEYDDVRKHASQPAVERYERFLRDKALEDDPEFRWCPGNSGQCGFGNLNADQDARPKMTCDACGTESCFTCRVVWHKGLKCAQYRSQRDSEDETTAFIRKTCKRCPARTCGKYIEKDGQCLEVKHSECNTNFCWDCKAILGTDLGHHGRVRAKHFATCQAREVLAAENKTFQRIPELTDSRYRQGYATDEGYERDPARDGYTY